MTHREYELIKFLMFHRGNAYSRDDLLNYVWGYDYSGETRTVDVHIRQLRRKLEDNPSKPKMIETVRGFGYRFKKDKKELEKEALAKAETKNGKSISKSVLKAEKKQEEDPKKEPSADIKINKADPEQKTQAQAQDKVVKTKEE